MDDFLGSIADSKEALNLSEELVSLFLPGLEKKLNPENSKIDSIKEIKLNDTATHVLR